MSIGSDAGSSPEMHRIVGNVEGQGMKDGKLEFSVSGPQGETNKKVKIAAKLIHPKGKGLGERIRSFINLFKSKRVTIKVENIGTEDIYKISIKAKDLAKELGLARKVIISKEKNGELEDFIIDKLGVTGHVDGLADKNALPETPVPPSRPPRVFRKPDSPLPVQPFTIPPVPANLDRFGLSNEDYKAISSYYNDNHESLAQLNETTHIKGPEIDPPLPRSVVYVPSGPRKGLYILCKTKGGAKEVGLGSFNLATKMLHIDTGEEKVFRNGRKQDVPESEISANERFKELDPTGEHFATGEVVRYQGPWRQRALGKRERELNKPKEHLHREENVEKVGLIMDLIPGGKLYDIIVVPPADRNLTPKENLGICLCIAKGLEVSHAAGLVNLDNKPGNIFMSGPNNLNPKTGDFGMVHNVGDTITDPCGTRGYFSPEILNTSQDNPLTVDTKNEMWIMGCMMSIITVNPDFAFATGQYSDNIFKIFNIGENSYTKSLLYFFPKHNNASSIDHAIVKCLSWNPKDRLSAAELVPILQKLYDTA